MEIDNDSLSHRHRGEQAPDNNRLRLRNVLNIIFMLLAIAGLVIYYSFDHTVGTIVILVAVVFKIVESALRIKF